MRVEIPNEIRVKMFTLLKGSRLWVVGGLNTLCDLADKEYDDAFA